MIASYPALKFGFDESQQLLVDTVTEFAQREIAPRAAEIDSTNEFPMDLWEKMGELGLHGMTVSENYGGSEMGYLAHTLAMQEISRASASVLSLIHI